MSGAIVLVKCLVVHCQASVSSPRICPPCRERLLSLRDSRPLSEEETEAAIEGLKERKKK